MEDFVLEIVNIVKNAINDPEINLDEVLRHYHEKDIADAYLELSKEEQDYFRDHIDEQFLSDIFAYFAEENIEAIEELPSDEIADIVELMDADDAKDILDELDEEKQDEVLDLIEGEIKEDLELINSFNEDEIGSLMTTNYIDIRSDLTIKDAMRRVIKMAKENDNVRTLIAVNRENEYLGTVDLKDLIKARAKDDLETIIRQNTPYLLATDLIDDSIEKIIDYNMDMIPVINENKKLLGVLTSSDVVELVDDTLSEDYAKLAGLSSEDDLDESLFSSIKKRIPWLIILIILSIGVSILISCFENVVAKIATIMFFQSLVLDMAGNVGTQSLAVTVRVISNSEVAKKEERKLIFKEIRVGFLNGLILAILSFASILAFLCIKHEEIIVGNGFSVIDCLKISGTTSLALITAMTLSSLFGTIVPIILRKMKVDPAAASGPFITTLNDCIAVICYYSLALIMFMAILL